MADSAERFDAIVSDFKSALHTLGGVLGYVAATGPAAELRVLILNNNIVALTAMIEEALRGLFREYLSILEESIDDHRELRETLQKANLESAIQKLKKHSREPDFKGAAILVSNLERCLNGRAGYQLLKEEITYNQGNFRSKQVTEMSKSVGITNLWRWVCDCSLVEDTTGESNLDARVTRTTATWNEIFDERDLVVHRISQASGWGAERIEQSIYLGAIVVERVAACLAADANELVPQAAQIKPDLADEEGLRPER